MLKSISFKKLAVLSAGIAIVLSSCGLQNSASESSGDAAAESSDTETAAGKTKNFALAPTGVCWDDLGAFLAAHNLEHQIHNNAWIAFSQANPGATWADFDAQFPWQSFFQNTSDLNGDEWNAFLASVNDGVPCPAGALAEEGEEAVGHATTAHCVKPEIKQQLIDGYTEQLARPVGGEVTDEYIAKMQKGLDVSNAMCTN